MVDDLDALARAVEGIGEVEVPFDLLKVQALERGAVAYWAKEGSDLIPSLQKGSD
jgi:hypothetical protein